MTATKRAFRERRKNGRDERKLLCGAGGRSSYDGREHFRRQFIWPVGTIKLFPQDHVKNNTAESVLLEQRDSGVRSTSRGAERPTTYKEE